MNPTPGVDPGRLPPWARKGDVLSRAARPLRRLLRAGRLHSVCEEARCPNLAECFSRGTATFLLLGEACTRRCAYCAVTTARPDAPDPSEPARVAATAARLELDHVVLTAAARDDLADGGAGHFAAAVQELREQRPQARVELLIPDFQGHAGPLETVVRARPDVLNHNIETVPRLFPRLRPQGSYQRSLSLLARAKALRPAQVTKSGLMVGLGESDVEVDQTLRDLRRAGVDVLTIGQYLRPSRRHAPVERYVSPRDFEVFAARARALGFPGVFSGVFVRSSYHAGDVLARLVPAQSGGGRP